MAAKFYGGAYLSSFVDALLEKMTSLLENDDSSLVERNNLLQRLQSCLYEVGPFLDDAELKQFTDKRVKKWHVDLQDALYFADDLLDELSTKTATATPRDPGISSYCSSLVDSILEDSGEMKDTVQTLESVVEQTNNLRLEESAKVDMSSWRTPSTSLVVSSNIFGRDKDKEKIIKLLLDVTCHAESPFTVIPIMGLGGIGKTTLSQLVYNDARVVENFDTRVWVCVAENSNPVHVTRTILGAIDSSSCRKDNFDVLQTNLKNKLIGKKFLVVLDDVWHGQRDTWEDFLKPFQYGNNGSKILLTTRSEKVASLFVAPSQYYQLSLLSDEDCWSVFLKHSSISSNFEQYATLEQIGRKIVKQCKGLPLAVKTLGGLLHHKYNVGDWENILRSKIWELQEDESMIIPALRVSYHYLPSHLKRCFVYCSLYPKDYQFDKDELILLWMAEGFIQPIENYILENIGRAYFDELFAMSFFQPSSKNVDLFVMHDLMHDLATFFAGEFYFRVKGFENQQKICNKTRHLSYTVNPNDSSLRLGEDYKRAIYIRTFLDVHLVHRYESIKIEGCSSWLLELHLRSLRVLSFKYFSIESLPVSIGKLIHLHYLDLSFTPIVELSESLCKLYNLQTLKLSYCYKLEMLPSRMQDLVNLRHLDIRGTYNLKEMPKGMSKLQHLNLLGHYVVGKHEENGIRELGPIDVHGSFRISNLENVNNSGEALAARMGDKKHINILELKWLPDGDLVDLQTERDILDKFRPHQNLKELSIDGYRGETFPDWSGLSLSCYSNMTKLSLWSCKNSSKLPSLGQLPSLQHLEIFGLKGLERIGDEFYKNPESSSSHEGTPFRSLETLAFETMYGLREWHIPDGFVGFPKLKSLEITDCPVLSGDLPAYFPALEQLSIIQCEELACSLPRAPKLRRLTVAGSDVHKVEQGAALIYGTRLANSVLEWLPHIHSPSLQRLIIQECSSAIQISGDYLPDSLHYLQIRNCSQLTFSEPLQHKYLAKLYVYKCDSVRLFPLGALPSLKKLEISDCSEIDSFREECLPPSLTTLGINNCKKLESWITSNGLQSEGLTHLSLEQWNEVKSFPREACLPSSLHFLQLSHFSNLEMLHCKGLHHLTSLTELTIKCCGKLENITQENLPASISKLLIKGQCPLKSKLEKMNDPRIQFETVKEDNIILFDLQSKVSYDQTRELIMDFLAGIANL